MQKTVWGRKGRSGGGERGITCTPATTMRPALKNMDDSTMHMSGSCTCVERSKDKTSD